MTKKKFLSFLMNQKTAKAIHRYVKKLGFSKGQARALRKEYNKLNDRQRLLFKERINADVAQ